METIDDPIQTQPPLRGGAAPPRLIAPARIARFGGALLVGLAVVGLAGGASAAQAAGPGGYGPGYQLVPGDRPSVVVLGGGEASAPAESGRLQLVVRAVDPFAGFAGGELAPSGPAGQPPPLSEEQVQPIVDALVEAGASAEAVGISVSPAFGGGFGSGSAQILIDLDGRELRRIEALVEAASTAAANAGLYVESVGAGFQIERCAELIAEARGRAAEDGRERAAAIADALDVELGGLLLASEVPGYNDGSGFGCSAAAPPPVPYGALYLPPFDPAAVPAVVVSVQLNLAYEMVAEGAATPAA